MAGTDEREKRRWAEVYEETPYRELPWFSARPFLWVERAVTDRWIQRGRRVLDVGCGAGTNSLYLASSGYRVSGIDLAPAAIASGVRRAERRHLKVDFRTGDALAIPFPKGSFAGAIDIGCFHTLPPSERKRYAGELARVVRPRGRFALAWVAREHTASLGPPHRPSLDEVAGTFEADFQFLRTEFLPGQWGRIPAYGALLERRATRQPAPR